MRTALLCCAAVVLALAWPGTAAADTTANGPAGQRLTVSKTSGLSPAGETVTVSGAGYDVTKGIYVAFCVDNGAGQIPTPCGGGMDMTGSSGASHWISSNPPAYGQGLAEPYGAGGTFRVSLKVSAALAEGVDCRTKRCAVVTRADHTRTSDRTQDVRVGVSFAGNAAPAAPTTAKATPGRTTAQPSGAVTSVPAPAVPPTFGSVAPARPEELTLTRTSASQSANRWWMGLSGALVLVVAAMAVRRFRKASA
ncbi:hypothetical protein [Dactylosporangium sp. CS-033363]|uniref:hypothetical protein n=1 Tax=Dactylosporangium sp. CS-033363 TaxID=3239935 RepID=UPI003D8A6B50